MAAATKTTQPVIHLPIQNPLEEAEDILRTDGWAVGFMKCDDGKRCAVGAVRAACGVRERTESKARVKNKAYVLSLNLLAAAIHPKYKTCEDIKQSIRSVVDVSYFSPTPEFDSLTAAQQVAVLESFIIQFNDGRSDNARGRNTVLRRFTRAAALYAQQS